MAGRPPSEIPKTQENLEATILRALELGINHIETARGYGTSKCSWDGFYPNYPAKR